MTDEIQEREDTQEAEGESMEALLKEHTDFQEKLAKREVVWVKVILVKAEQESAISTSRRFDTIRLGSEELFDFPLAVMTGEGTFTLTDQERQNLKQYVERGGLLLASAGCSSAEWDRSFRQEMAKVFPAARLTPIGMDHPVFHTVSDITQLQAKHGQPRPLEGVTLAGRLGVLYSQDGLNDTAHTQGCCCCGGNEILNCIQINVNILAYALTH